MTEVLDPFAAATSVRSLGDGTFVANLHPEWVVGDKPHGGYLLALLARALGDVTGLAPLSVSAHFLRAPRVGPVLIRTEVLKTGRTVTAARALLEQRGEVCVDATLSLGTVPEGDAVWSQLPDMPVNPPPNAVDLAATEARKFFALAQVCDMRLDPGTAEFLTGGTGAPRLRLWVKPREAQPDLLFGLVAGDLTMPVTVNLGRFGWAPTVQLTALLRANPANGWLRLAVDCRVVQNGWFDEDVTVVDSMGRLVCQARQLALVP
ncbi:aromatic compound degradation protein PaaI [Saccharopolyspora subtropica]|uniref:Aromatic compound degradation protein PaaI n=1 Tax=Saccharopolyspora thermophila TaxID=89367 RepID=A0A917K147_9PSEU|nr:thioesterase family protein [Saccharopolyspora subtropica]GGI92980.1 aromatic compound degradation protein PaaI [Saccharopolyspora subtropica]